MIDSYGPYGSNLEQNYCVKANDGERITEVRIRRGNAINAIVFVIENSREYSTSNEKIDGDEQKVIITIYIVQICVISLISVSSLILC